MGVTNVPVSPTRNIVGKGSSAVVFKFECKGKIVACKKFKQCVSMKSLLKAADSLLKLEIIMLYDFPDILPDQQLLSLNTALLHLKVGSCRL